MWIYVNVNVNVNMLRNSRNNGMKKKSGKSNIVSVLWIIFMFVCVIKKYTEEIFWIYFSFLTLNSFFGHFMLHKHNAAGSLIYQHSNPLT